MATDRVKRAQQAYAALEQKNIDLSAQLQELQSSLDKHSATMGGLALQGGDVDKLAAEITRLESKKRVLLAAKTELERQAAAARVELQAAQREAAQMRLNEIAEEANKHVEAYRGAVKQAMAELDTLVRLQVEAHALCNQHTVTFPGQSFPMSFDAVAFRDKIKAGFDSLAAQEQAWSKGR